MPTTTPTPAPGVPELVLDFFWNHWLGQLLLGTAILGLLGWIFRTWIKHRLTQLATWLRDLRLTRRSTVDAEIASAVAASETEWEARVEEVRASGADEAARLREQLRPPEPATSPEDIAAKRDQRRHDQSVRDRWVISTNRSSRQGYVLRNYAARETTNVRLKSPSAGAFEFIGTPRWEKISEGESVPFTGRIADPSRFAIFERELEVSWTDDHGDEQTKRVQVDRDHSRATWW